MRFQSDVCIETYDIGGREHFFEARFLQKESRMKFFQKNHAGIKKNFNFNVENETPVRKKAFPKPNMYNLTN